MCRTGHPGGQARCYIGSVESAFDQQHDKEVQVQIVVTGRHMSVTEAMKQHAEEKAQRLVRFYGRVQEIRAVLDLDGGQPTAEFIVAVEHAEDFVAREQNDDMYAAIDTASDKLERQLRKHKERIDQKHKGHLSEHQEGQ